MILAKNSPRLETRCHRIRLHCLPEMVQRLPGCFLRRPAHWVSGRYFFLEGRREVSLPGRFDRRIFA